MEQYLAFIDEIGRTIDGNYLYRFDFTKEPDIFWGEYFHIDPTIIIPNLQPDTNYVSTTCHVELPVQLNLAKKNGCFSMQDCFEHIISLAFTDIDEDKPLIFDYAETFEKVDEKLKSYGSQMTDIEEKDNDNDGIINNLIENIEKYENPTIDYEDSLYKEILTLEVGQTIDFETINQTLFDNAYERTDFVHKKGQYSIRGHIIDIFTYHYKYKFPFRISFFGNEIEEIYTFDIMEQTPIEKFDKITIYNNNI